MLPSTHTPTAQHDSSSSQLLSEHQIKERNVLFIGNITQDTVITYSESISNNSSTLQPLSENGNHYNNNQQNQFVIDNSRYEQVKSQSLGGSVMFGCLAFQHYMKDTTTTPSHHLHHRESPTNTNKRSSSPLSSHLGYDHHGGWNINHTQPLSSLFQPRIFTKIGKRDVRKLLRFFESRLDDEHHHQEHHCPSNISIMNDTSYIHAEDEGLLDVNTPQHVQKEQPDLCVVKKLRGLKMFENIVVVDHHPHEDEQGEMPMEESSKLTQYELCYPPPLENGMPNQRTLSCLDRGSIFHHDDIQHILENQQLRQGHLEALFFVPVAAEFDHHFVKHFSEKVMHHYCHSPMIICTDIQGYLRKIESGGKVSHNSFEYLQQVLSVLSTVVSIIKLDHEEAKKCIENSENLSPEACALILQEQYGFPIVNVTMGGGGSVCASKGSEITFHSKMAKLKEEQATSQPQSSKVKYFPAFKPKRVRDETGAGDTFLSCFVAELLLTKHSKFANHDKLDSFTLTYDEIFECVKMASSSTSFRVEERGLNGFASRRQAYQRVCENQD
nr:unnamed protein product [Naegleria fowleri]